MTSMIDQFMEHTQFNTFATLIVINKHKNGSNSESFTDAELNFDMIVARSCSEHTLRVTSACMRLCTMVLFKV